MGVIHNQALDSKLHQGPHELGLPLAPTTSQRQSQGCEQVIAKGLLPSWT